MNLPFSRLISPVLFLVGAINALAGVNETNDRPCYVKRVAMTQVVTCSGEYGGYTAYTYCEHYLNFGESIVFNDSWSGGCQINYYLSSVVWMPKQPTVFSVSPANGCNWLKQGQSISKADLNVVTCPAGQADAPNIVVLDTTVNSTNLSNGTASNPGGIGTFSVRVSDGQNVVAYTFNVVDEGRELEIGLPEFDYSKFRDLWNEATIKASSVGIGIPGPNIQGQVTGRLSNRLCGCEVKLMKSSVQGTITGVLGKVTVTSPEFPVYGAAKARFQLAAEGSGSLAVSGQTSCGVQNLCGEVGGKIDLAVTASICAVNCNLISVNGTAAVTFDLSGEICTQSGADWDGSVGSLTISGDIRLATMQVASYTYPVW